jgi:hypothetical protein
MYVTRLIQSLRNKGKKLKGTVISERRTWINQGAVHLGFMIDNVRLGHILPGIL